MYETLTLSGDNRGEILITSPDNIVYLHAADNYTRIFYYIDGRVSAVLFRSTLKKQEEALVAYGAFYRCHKRYLVNFNHVRGISGNALGLKLYLPGAGCVIPVSRNLNKEAMALYKQYHTPLPSTTEQD